MSVRMVEDPIINNLLSRLKRTIVTKEEVVHRESDGEEDNLSSGSGDEPLTEATDNLFYPGGEGFDYDYLDSLLSAEINNDDAEKEDPDKSEIVYRDFPVDEGYVRIPVQYPGLTLTQIQAPPPKLWTAEESFKTQVPAYILPENSISTIKIAFQVVPTLYMFIPAALLGFIIGMGIWIIILSVLRVYSTLRKMTETKNQGAEAGGDVIGDLRLSSLSGDPWRRITDAETVHTLDGSLIRGDRVWRLRQESKPGFQRTFGGSERKPPRRADFNNDSRLSTRSEGKKERSV